MECVLVCVTLACLSGFWVEHHVAAMPAFTVQVRVGEDATLQCPLLDASNAAPAPPTLSWYRKFSGQSPQLLLTFRPTNTSNVTYGSGLGPEKVSATADGSLLLLSSEPSDSAVYYCGISHGEGRKN